MPQEFELIYADGDSISNKDYVKQDQIKKNENNKSIQIDQRRPITKDNLYIKP